MRYAAPGRIRLIEAAHEVSGLGELAGLFDSSQRSTASFVRGSKNSNGTAWSPAARFMQSWTTNSVGTGVEILDRMNRAAAKVRERLLRSTTAPNRFGVPYAVVVGRAAAFPGRFRLRFSLAAVMIVP